MEIRQSMDSASAGYPDQYPVEYGKIIAELEQHRTLLALQMGAQGSLGLALPRSLVLHIYFWSFPLLPLCKNIMYI